MTPDRRARGFALLHEAERMADAIQAREVIPTRVSGAHPAHLAQMEADAAVREAAARHAISAARWEHPAHTAAREAAEAALSAYEVRE